MTWCFAPALRARVVGRFSASSRSSRFPGRRRRSFRPTTSCSTCSVLTLGSRASTPDGAQVWTTTGGAGSGWVGAAITPGGHVISTFRTPTWGLNVFDASGVNIATFVTPQLQNSFGDVNVFADGTLAV